ncbi:MAG: hypothetical protein F6K31_08420 [Symploca sp. SIO2G7]|nr:hypothetical protein [Symploca sp. SIO2G7]
MASSNNVPSQNNQGDNGSEKFAIPTQKDARSTETPENIKKAIEQAKAIPQGLLENPTQGASSDMNIKDHVEASKDAVNKVKKEMPSVEQKESFIDSLKEQSRSSSSSLLTTGIQAQWQSHREIIKCFNETPFSKLRGSIWH